MNTETTTDYTTAGYGASETFSTSRYKLLAKEHLAGKFWPYIGFGVLLIIVCSAISRLGIIGIVLNVILTGPVIFGQVSIPMAVVEGRSPGAADAFAGFVAPGKKIAAGLLVMLYYTLWSLLIIPGIIKTFSYSATFYLMREYPELGPNEAITRSRKLMDGHKMEAFILSFSFFGWILLTAMTFGILAFYTIPYMHTTLAEFYSDLIKKEVR